MLGPKVDYSFKRILENEQKLEIFIGFLNDFLHFSGDNAICCIEYRNPINDKNYNRENLSVMDEEAETKKGEICKHRNSSASR